MRVVVISLERSHERRDHVRGELERAGMSYEIFDAFDGAASRHLTAPHYSVDACVARLGRPLSDGELGCFLSHYTLWQRAAAADETFLVMEDDVDVAPAAGGALAIIDEVAATVGLVRLACLRQRRGRKVRDAGGGYSLVRYPRRLVGTHAYAISPQGARKLIAKAGQWVEPVDEYLDRFWLHGLDIFGLVPFIVQPHEDSQSEIGTARRQTLLRGTTKLRRELVRIGDVAGREAANFAAWRRYCGAAARTRLAAWRMRPPS